LSVSLRGSSARHHERTALLPRFGNWDWRRMLALAPMLRAALALALVLALGAGVGAWCWRLVPPVLAVGGFKPGRAPR
jgi:hypothetical protein